MADPRVVKYIRDTLAKGFSEQEVGGALAKQGWGPEEISDAMGEARGPGPQVEGPTRGAGKGPDMTQGRGKDEPSPGAHGRDRVMSKIMGWGFMLSMVGGALIVANSLMVFLSAGDLLGLFASGVSISFIGLLNISLTAMDSLVINLMIGGFLIATTLILYMMPDRGRVTGVFILALSLISIMIGNGFLIGGMVAVVGGLFAMLGM